MFKVDRSGYPTSLGDSSNPGGVWPGPPPTNAPGPAPPHLMHPGPGPSHHPHPHPHPHPNVNPSRIPMMPFSPHPPIRPFRPTTSPAPEYRFHDLNKRLLMRTEECDSLWWESFVNEFFEDDATLSISLQLEDGLKRFTIGRVLIPRFFRTLFDGGVNEVQFLVKQTKEMFHNPVITLDCEQASMIISFGKPAHIKVCNEGNLTLEYIFDDLMRIKSWHFAIKQYRELIPRSVVAIPTDNPSYLEQLSKNITRCGLTTVMLNFLRLCEILEPMQELMSRHKTTSFSPRDCLKTTLHQRWSKNFSVDNRPQPKTRRKKRAAATNNTPTNPTPTPSNLPMTKDPNLNNCTMASPAKKRSPGNATFSQTNQGSTINPTMNSSMPGDVMIVGEPSLMGGEMDDEDERYITRIENAQYDPNASHSSHSSAPPLNYLSPTQPMSSGYHSQLPPTSSNTTPSSIQNPNLQSILHHKQQPMISNSSLIHPNQMKREQVSYPGSPSSQSIAQQPLPSMFSNTGPPTPSTNSNVNVFPAPPSTPINGETSAGGKRISSSGPTNPSSTSPSTPSANHNQNPSTPSGNTTTTTSIVNPPTTPTNSSWTGTTSNSSTTTNTTIGEKKQEPQTPPATPQQQQQQQQTIATAS